MQDALVLSHGAKKQFLQIYAQLNQYGFKRHDHIMLSENCQLCENPSKLQQFQL
jgi:hypothetical protein